MGLGIVIASADPAVFLCSGFAAASCLPEQLASRLALNPRRHRGPGQQEGELDFWHVLAAALALVFIIEGMLPFISPHRWRSMLALAEQMDDRVIRNVGLGSMLFGLLILYWVH